MTKKVDESSLFNDKKIILRTKICDAAKVLDDMGIEYITLDNIYDDANDFDILDKMLADDVIRTAKNEEVLYVVPGSAVTLDGSVNEIFKSYNDVEILAGSAPEYDLFANCKDANASCGYAVIPAGCLEAGMFSPRLPLVVTALDNSYLLSDVKILLSEEYGDEHEVIVGDNKGYKKTKIYGMDRYDGCDHNTMVYVPVRTKAARFDIHELQNVFRKLRSPEGCPWDREQTHELSLIHI
jgi:tetrapyrrole methylase family protein/MazG family protein